MRDAAPGLRGGGRILEDRLEIAVAGLAFDASGRDAVHEDRPLTRRAHDNLITRLSGKIKDRVDNFLRVVERLGRNGLMPRVVGRVLKERGEAG